MTNSTGLRILLAAFVLSGLYLAYAGYQLRYYGRTGPGPGFFLVWIGGLLALCSTWALVKEFLEDSDSSPFIESREAAYRVGIVLLSLFGNWLLLNYLGFKLAILIFAILVPPILGRQRFIITLGVAIIVSFGTAYVFENWLDVWLPRSSIAFLANLGF